MRYFRLGGRYQFNSLKSAKLELSDLQLAQRIVAKPGDSPAYIVRDYHRPNDQYDHVILPAHANLIVYHPHALSHTQLTTLIEHVASVRGKLILCDDRSDFANYHPELNEAVERSISRAVPSEFRKNLEPPNPADGFNQMGIHQNLWVNQSGRGDLRVGFSEAG